jgi:Flp pilus assembly pilin Flp
MPPHPPREFLLGDDGMSTVEYAVGLAAAVAFAMVLYAVISGTDVADALTALVQRALTVK